jgi:hypothetical protein
MTTIVCYDLMEEIGKYYKKFQKEIQNTKKKKYEVIKVIDLLRFMNETGLHQMTEYHNPNKSIEMMFQYKNEMETNFYFKGQEDKYDLWENFRYSVKYGFSIGKRTEWTEIDCCEYCECLPCICEVDDDADDEDKELFNTLFKDRKWNFKDRIMEYNNLCEFEDEGKYGDLSYWKTIIKD